MQPSTAAIMRVILHSGIALCFISCADFPVGEYTFQLIDDEGSKFYELTKSGKTTKLDPETFVRCFTIFVHKIHDQS